MVLNYYYKTKYSNDHIQVIALGDTPLFYNERDGPFFPTLRLLHQCIYYEN